MYVYMYITYQCIGTMEVNMYITYQCVGTMGVYMYITYQCVGTMGVIHTAAVLPVLTLVNVLANLYRLKSEVTEVYKLHKGRLLKNYKKSTIRKKKTRSIKPVLRILCLQRQHQIRHFLKIQ